MPGPCLLLRRRHSAVISPPGLGRVAQLHTRQHARQQSQNQPWVWLALTLPMKKLRFRRVTRVFPRGEKRIMRLIQPKSHSKSVKIPLESWSLVLGSLECAAQTCTLGGSCGPALCHTELPRAPMARRTRGRETGGGGAAWLR